MARRFFRRKARSFRSYGRKAYRASSTGGISPMKVGVSAAAYGAFRDKIHSYIPNVGIPYSDSLITGAIGYYMAKKKGWMKNAGIAILAVEAAAVGNSLGSGMLGGSSSASNLQTNNNLTGY